MTGGSSPLSRGIRGPGCSRYRRRGIIPALAGNTRSCGSWGMTARDHPRSRGEYSYTVTRDECYDGSSPLSRGIRRPRSSATAARRIIPALAGNTVGGGCAGCWCKDHPRSRGEYLGDTMAELIPKGSSPLSRGIPRRALQAPGRGRIIPALAGNTYLEANRTQRGGGSSPLSRGIQSCTPLPLP